MSNIILGAGVTGLSAAIKTGYPIYEAGDKPGGICRSYYTNGYRFENGGGHWIFGSNDVVDFMSNYAEMDTFKRDAGVYYNKIFKYPIQSFDEEGYFPSTLKGWLIDKFGNDMCRMFFWPFNNKYTDGLFEYVVQDDPKKSPRPGQSGYNDVFAYPKQGLDKLIDNMAKGLEINYYKKAVMILPEKRRIIFSDGKEVNYERLISTIPLDELLIMCGYEGYCLPKTSVLVLNIGAKKGKFCPKNHWLYIPDEAVKFFRVGFYSNVMSEFAPNDDHVSIYVERAFANKKDLSGYKEEVIRQLQDWGWIGNVEICDHNWIECAYTWVMNETNRDKYIKWLADRGITSTGRYGKWRFQGLAESVMDGLSIT